MLGMFKARVSLGSREGKGRERERTFYAFHRNNPPSLPVARLLMSLKRGMVPGERKYILGKESFS